MGTIGNGEKRERGNSGKGLLALTICLAVVASLVGVAVGVMVTAAGSGLSVATLGNQERQDITAANQWVEGNIDFWLESHLYDTEVRLDAGTSPTTLPSTIDFGMSFFFSNNNAIVIDWTQDWHVTFNQSVMFWTKTSAPAGAPYTCSVPPNIVSIPVNGRSIQVPQGGSVCIQNVAANGDPSNPAKGWVDLSALPLSDLNKVIPRRNEPCTSMSGGLCVSGAESESSPATEHYFRLDLAAMFGTGGKYASSFPGTWPKLDAGKSLAFYFRNHLAMTSVWETAVGGTGGGSQPQFCINTAIGARLNTNYDRCNWKTISRFGAGYASGSKNHGDVFAPGIGDKTIPLPNVVAPTGFITACKIVTLVSTDQDGSEGTLTKDWSMTVTGPFGTSETKLTGSSGCVKFGPLFPGTYAVNETVQSGYVNIGTVVTPSTDRAAGFGGNPSPYNPVNVTLTFTEAQGGTGPTVTFVNFEPKPSLAESCSVTIKDAFGNSVYPSTRDYAIAGDNVTFTFTVTNNGNEPLTVTQTHTNTAQFGPSPLFSGSLASGASNVTPRSYVVQTGDQALADTCSASGVDAFGNEIYAPTSGTCFVSVHAPQVSFTKWPQPKDNVFVVPYQNFTYGISVTNSGNATALVTVSEVLGAGQTLLLGGPLTGDNPQPTVTPTIPAKGADYPAQVTISWVGLSVAPDETIVLNFTVLVTSTVDGAAITGAMTLTATNTNGVGYTPDPNTAQNRITVTRPILKLTQFGYTNEPFGTPTQGVVSGNTTYTIVFTNFGSDAATLTGDFIATVSGQGGGTLACSAVTGDGVSLTLTETGCTLHFEGISVGVGGTFTIVLKIAYRNFASGAVIDANLTASYMVEGSSTPYIPSGTPAEIKFTIQGG